MVAYGAFGLEVQGCGLGVEGRFFRVGFFGEDGGGAVEVELGLLFFSVSIIFFGSCGGRKEDCATPACEEDFQIVSPSESG